MDLRRDASKVCIVIAFCSLHELADSFFHTSNVANSRRLYIVCFLIALVVGTEGSNDIETPFYLPLPGTKTLWEARSQWVWEKEYGASWKDLKPQESRLGTVGDLAIARLQQRGRANATVRGNLEGALDEVLDNWHADLDGLGMMLAAVVADV